MSASNTKHQEAAVTGSPSQLTSASRLTATSSSIETPRPAIEPPPATHFRPGDRWRSHMGNLHEVGTAPDGGPYLFYRGDVAYVRMYRVSPLPDAWGPGPEQLHSPCHREWNKVKWLDKISQKERCWTRESWGGSFWPGVTEDVIQ